MFNFLFASAKVALFFEIAKYFCIFLEFSAFLFENG